MLNRLLCSILIICSLYVVNGQKNKLNYSQQFTISEGMEHNGITSILQDSRGYIWFGTYDGLNHYNGYEFKIFKNRLNKSKDILASNRIRTIAEDRNGNLWIGTDEGISLYNYQNERFSNIYTHHKNASIRSGPIVRKIVFNKYNEWVICLTEESGILIFKEDGSFIKQLAPLHDNSVRNLPFYDGVHLESDNYLFASSYGLLLFNLKTKKFKTVLPNKVTYSSAIIKANENTFLTTFNHGLGVIYMEKQGDDFLFSLKKRELNEETFTCLGIDKQNNLWLGTKNDGMLHINSTDAFISNLSYEKSYYRTGADLIRTSSLLITEQNGCWFGTFNKGVFQFKLQPAPFNYYNTKMNYPNGMWSNEIIQIEALDSKRAFLTANSGGIALLNTESQKFEPIPFPISSKQEESGVQISVDSDKNILLKYTGTKGITKISPTGKLLTTINSDLIPSLGLYRLPHIILKDKQANLWIGDKSGLYKIVFDKNQNIEEIESLNTNPLLKGKPITMIRSLYFDEIYNYAWVGTDTEGLLRLDLNIEKSLKKVPMQHYINHRQDTTSLPSNFVSCIKRIPNGELWLGTEGGGIVKVENSHKTPKFISFSEKQGLSNNVVKNFLWDHSNNLWVSTNVGLNKFCATDQSFRKFTIKDGLPFEDFNYGAVVLDNGQFIFSGINGFCYFNPNHLPNDEPLPKLEFASLSLFNSNISPGDSINGRILLNKRLGETQTIDLKYNEDVFSVEVNALHYSNAKSHYLKYKLSPINEEWILTPSDQKKIAYNGLQPGSYELKVMASNTLNKWTPQKTLQINISPPFWKTNLAILLYVLALVAIVYIILIIKLKMQSMHHAIEIDKIEIDNVKKLNASKLRFFSNISHEIKTPLTLINGPLEILYDRYASDPDSFKKFKLVQRQTNKISGLLDQVLDFQKSEAQVLKLTYTVFDFDSFIKELLTDYELMAESEQKTLLLEKENVSEVYVKADKDKLEKILNNILNNAFKFTRKADTIRFSYKCKNNNLLITLSDTGQGIKKDDVEHIFKRFYQSQHKQIEYIGGSGIGLSFSKRLVEMHYGQIWAASELGTGTDINISLPVIHEKTEVDIEEQKVKMILNAEKKAEANLIETNFSKLLNDAILDADKQFENSSVFLVEDNIEMKMFISEILSKFFIVTTFSNGKECLEAMEEVWPDIIISDLLMPLINGLQLCKTVKSDIKTSHIPVILLTACTTMNEQIQGVQDGADAYIKKPFNTAHLIASVESLLQNRKQLRERFQMNMPLVLAPNKTSKDNAIFMEKLYELMDDNLDNANLDFNQIAKNLYINRTQFYQKVKSITNQTPMELMKDYRIKKAADLLRKNNYSVSEVCSMVGFKSRTHFTNLFKKMYKTTPGKYAVKQDV
ncbi:hybrid sensor histidine kinase/response regulator transcription factor [Zobellia roscoffensis]|uniref:hybrid sensor histidine kinase/response regulator transcription factor n=1 Tax=Zobellia roscoffensis TaxID=2779508 RepID=UPI00188B3C99|nr:hybrid sensor histidine kinase/response regulator transcription factor [Zobellia roscoffensis]